MSNFDGLLPGDTVTIPGFFTVTNVDAGMSGTESVMVEDDLDISDFNYEIESQPRPENWPPDNGDVWVVNHVYYYFLDDEFVDVNNDDVDIIEYLSDDGLMVMDMSLSFRPGITDRK